MSNRSYGVIFAGMCDSVELGPCIVKPVALPLAVLVLTVFFFILGRVKRRKMRRAAGGGGGDDEEED